MSEGLLKTIIIAGATIIGLILLIILIKINGGGDVRINKNGVIVRAKTKRFLSSKEFINYLKEVINYIEEAKEQYMDDIIGIKNRYFKQSKDFAKSRIDAVKNNIINDYKIEYMSTYSGRLHPVVNNEKGELIIETTAVLPTKAQCETEDNDGSKKPNSPCSTMCAGGCNSGLSFFDDRLQKDFKPILEEVYGIIEANHLINRADREYEEEITSKAEQLSTHLRNMIISYPVPIDNKIARKVIDARCPEVKEAIADSLRRSRTLSQTKRDVIDEEKKKYIERRNKQLTQIINILNEEDADQILGTDND